MGTKGADPDGGLDEAEERAARFIAGTLVVGA
jgi:hypothetical protein